MKGIHYRKGGLLLLALLLGSTLGWAQPAEVVVNDLAFVLGDAAGQYSNRTQLRDELNAFANRHALQVSLTILLEDDLYQQAARQQETQWLQQATPTLVITSWHDADTKARSRTQVQVNEALASRLPQATAEQIIVEALDYYSTNPLSGDALLQGMSLALRRLDAYLDALPPAGEVPTTTFTNPATAPPASPPPGLDELHYPAHQGNYEQTTIHQADYAVAWKALPSGRPTTVLAQVDQEVSFPPGVVFRQNDNPVPSQPGSKGHQQQLTLTGQAHQQEGSLLVYASAEEDAELVGKLNTISYDVLPKTLVLIALDGTIDEYDPEVQQTGQEVQRIFAQAGVELNVTFAHFNTTWGNRDTLLEDNTSGMLSNYPKQLRRVIKDYRKAHRGKEEEETAYIFLAGGSASGRKGYMPKKRNYGFVFLHNHQARESLARTIAHELGHGWFRLEHSWQTYPALSEGNTDNLMDYGKGQRLHKYQWDLIHDPVSMLGWFQDEEDISSYEDPYAYFWREINALSSAVSYSVYKFNKWVDQQKRSILSLFDFSDVELTSDEEKVYEILTAIQEDDLESLSDYTAEAIITGQDLQLGEESYEKLIIYFLRGPEAIDVENYRAEEKAEEGYALLIFSAEENADLEILRIQVAHEQKEALEAFLFGEEEESEVDVEPEDLESGLHVFENEEEIASGSYVHITAVPEMPALKFIYADTDEGEEIEMRLLVEYKRDIRQDEDYFPSKVDWKVMDPNETWTVDFGSKIRGGRAKLEWKRGDEEGHFVFHVRAKNPTEQEVKNYINQQGYSTWFFTRLIRQESNYRQFNPPASLIEGEEGYGPDWEDGRGCPNWGSPHGWGLTQLDLLDGGQRPTAEELWSWKANVDRGHGFLSGEKWSIANNWISGRTRVINRWNADNPDDPVQNHIDQTEGGINYTHASSQSFSYEWGGLVGNSRSFLDAVWIKSYNGNSGGYYYHLVVPNTEIERPYWELRRTNSHNHNYVEAVSGRAE